MGPGASAPAAAAGHYQRKDAAPGKSAARGGVEAALQESFLWAGGSLLLATAAILIGILARSLLVDRWTRPQRFSMSGADLWVLEQNAGRAGYFIDIGAAHHADLSNTRLLEQRGWSGVCVDPDERPYEARECGWVTRPISAKGGERVDVPVCRNRSCSESRATTIGIDNLLTLLDAPPVIDYVSISARSRGLDMLDGFPWDRHCVRFWTVEHAGEASQMTGLWKKLGAQRCRMAVGVADFWAACGCGADAAPPPLPNAAGRPGAARADGPARLAADDRGEGGAGDRS